MAAGGLGFWAALPEEFAGVQEQRGWVHKTANVLDKLPKSLQPAAKEQLHEMYLAPTRAQALLEYDRFLKLYGVKYPKACECLRRDQDVLFTFYAYPAELWTHLRTTHPIEIPFATARYRTRQTKGCGSVGATLAMVFQLARVAEKHWRRLNGYALLRRVLLGVKFVNGLEVESEAKAAWLNGLTRKMPLLPRHPQLLEISPPANYSCHLHRGVPCHPLLCVRNLTANLRCTGQLS